MLAAPDRQKVMQVANLLRQGGKVTPFPFLDPFPGARFFPQQASPLAVPFFFTAVMHQYGFWTSDGDLYGQPYRGQVDGDLLKGSDFMWRCILRKAQASSQFLEPAYQAQISRSEFDDVFRTDDGTLGLPMLDSHFQLMRGFGQDMVQRGWTPARMVDVANGLESPFASFLEALTTVTGYKEDPLQKKASLLAIALCNRPEHFLEISSADFIPIVDYHIQRTFLRTGMVKVPESALQQSLVARKFVDAAQEQVVRKAVHEAVLMLSKDSGCDIAAIDWFFFGLRKTCYEDRPPECHRCPAQTACEQNSSLFQPVFRTTAY